MGDIQPTWESTPKLKLAAEMGIYVLGSAQPIVYRQGPIISRFELPFIILALHASSKNKDFASLKNLHARGFAL